MFLSLEDCTGLCVMGIIVISPFVLLGAVPPSILVCLIVLAALAFNLHKGG